MESTYVVMNLGSLLIVFVTLILRYVFYLILHRCGKCVKVKKVMGKELFWAALINYCGPAYMEIAFAVIINYQRDLQWTGGACYFNNFILFVFTGILAFPLLAKVVLVKYYGIDTGDKYGYLFEQV